MLYFAIMSTDVDNSLPLRQQARPDHLARLHALEKAGRLLLAGPHPATDEAQPAEPAFTGSLVVAAFDSLADARSWADDDP